MAAHPNPHGTGAPKGRGDNPKATEKPQPNIPQGSGNMKSKKRGSGQ